VDLAPPVDLYLRRNRLEETTFLYDFFHHPAIADQLAGYEHLTWPAGAVWPHEPTLRLTREGSWVTTARLAQTLQFGPAVGSNRVTDRELTRLLPRFAEAAFFGEYSSTFGYSGFEPWSPWFCGQHFDSTYLWLNKARGIATVVLMSDRP
jgi:hypothetical protein